MMKLLRILLGIMPVWIAYAAGLFFPDIGAAGASLLMLVAGCWSGILAARAWPREAHEERI